MNGKRKTTPESEMANAPRSIPVVQNIPVRPHLIRMTLTLLTNFITPSLSHFIIPEGRLTHDAAIPARIQRLTGRFAIPGR